MSGSGSDLTPIPREWIAPIRQLVELYEEYGSLPRAIFGIISLYIVNSVLELGSLVVETVLLVSDMVVGTLGLIQAELGVSFTLVGTALLNAVWGVQLDLMGLLVPYGPLTPVVTIGLVAVELLVIWRLLVAIAGELPVGSSLVDLLGLR